MCVQSLEIDLPFPRILHFLTVCGSGGKDGVKDVQVRPGRPASVADILSWEKVKDK